VYVERIDWLCEVSVELGVSRIVVRPWVLGYEVVKLILTYETIGLVTYVLITHILVPVLILMKILLIAHLSFFLPDIFLENHPLLLFGCFLFQKLPLLILLVPQVL
jgi:hypothetical protein